MLLLKIGFITLSDWREFLAEFGFWQQPCAGMRILVGSQPTVQLSEWVMKFDPCVKGKRRDYYGLWELCLR